MKSTFTLVILLLLFAATTRTFAQYEEGRAIEPLKNNSSAAYGNDVYIHDDPSENQRQAGISIAFNGWLYSCYTLETGGFQVARSTDNGITWSSSGTILPEFLFPEIDLIVVGNSESNLTVMIGYICNAAGSYNWFAGYAKLDKDLGNLSYSDLDSYISSSGFKDVAIATDFLYPSVGATPFSIGLLYSKSFPVADTLIFFTSADGGNTFSNRVVVSHGMRFLHHVSLSFGRSLSQSNGRYFAAWEELTDVANVTGRIYTAHSEPFFNSSFTTPFRLDNIVPSFDGVCRNPSITCQQNNVDNDSANLTELISFDRCFNLIGDFDIVGAYNLQATTTSFFNSMWISTTLNNEIQSDASYDPFYDNFLVTYYDSTARKLPYVVKNINMPDPNLWTKKSHGYNNDTNLATPYPKVRINPVKHQAAHVWNAERPGGNGAVLFNSEYSTNPGISEIVKAGNCSMLMASPNPCINHTTLKFNLNQPAGVSVKLYNLYGQIILTTSNRSFPGGMSGLELDVTQLTAGCYFYEFISGNEKNFGKFIVR